MDKNTVTGVTWVGLMQIGCLVVTICSVAPFLVSAFWYFDLLSSFRFQYLILSVLFTVGFFIAKQKIYAAVSVCCVLVNALYVIPVFASWPDEHHEHQNSIKLYFANVYTANEEHDLLIQQLLAEKADVVLLQEVNAQWLSALKQMAIHYPYSIEVPREDNFGIAVFSQTPINNHQIHEWTLLDIPSIELEIEVAGQPIRIITTHPPPPINRYYYQAGQQQFAAIASAIKNKDMPSIVIGDLNATVWSENYPILTSGTGLTNASHGQGFMPTWPTNLLPFMIPIDHCLVSEHFGVIDIETGEGFGSDHWPLIVELGF